MNNLKIIFFFIFSVLSIASCSKEDIKTQNDIGIPTELKGNVKDYTRGINISGYKIVFVKSWRKCVNYACPLTIQEIETTYTDDNGNYSIKFNHKLNEGESYGLSEQYYGTPYYPEYLPSLIIKAGQTNIKNIDAWKPIKLQMNIEVLNNNNSPLMVRNEILNSDLTFYNPENIYEQNIVKTYNMISKPDQDVKIIFWYNGGTYSVPIIHQKIFTYHTTLDDVNVLNYSIDCSTF